MSFIPDISKILENINAEMPYFWRLLTALAFFMGICYAILSMHMLKKYGDARAGASGQADIKKPILYMLVSAALLYFPTTLQNILETFYATSQITPYSYGSGSDSVSNFLNLAGNFIQIIGFIAFLRGWVLILRIGDQGQAGVLGRALIHIFAGIMAINIFGTWSIVKSIFGV